MSLHADRNRKMNISRLGDRESCFCRSALIFSLDGSLSFSCQHQTRRVMMIRRKSDGNCNVEEGKASGQLRGEKRGEQRTRRESCLYFWEIEERINKRRRKKNEVKMAAVFLFLGLFSWSTEIVNGQSLKTAPCLMGSLNAFCIGMQSASHSSFFRSPL